jgi:Ca2+-binding RTX toxin-like protein
VARSLPALIGATGVAALCPAGADAHSLVRTGGNEVAYLSSDAVSLNTLVVKRTGSNIDLRDPTVDGGLDPGPCAPGDITDDANSWVIQVLCPAAGAGRLRIDLGDREDSAVVALDLPVTLLGGTGADKLTTGGGADAVAGDDGDDVIQAGAGDDQVNAGDGDDEVEGGAGNDVVEAGLGVDNVAGGDGDDDLRLRDGVADTVRCGAGTDRVDADTLDDIALDCERVSRLPTPAPEAGGTTGRDRVAPRVRVGGSTVQRAGRGRFQLVATSSERGTISASGFIDVAGLSLPISADRQRVGVGGGGVRLTVKLTARQRREAARAWKRGRRVRARLGVVGTDRAGNSAHVKAPAIRLLR